MMQPRQRAWRSYGIVGVAAFFCLILSAQILRAEESDQWRHGLSVFGELKYATDFEHFDYVNPDAPKGGELSTVGSSDLHSFDNLNPFILRGVAAAGLEYVFDTLMTPAGDEPDALYGLVAESAVVAPDRTSVTFNLREAARFHDGSPIRAEDIVFSFEILKKEGHPNYRQSLRDVTKAQALNPLTVRFTFEGDQTRDLPLIVAELPVLSKAYYTEHAFNKTTLEPPLGSGPYKVDSAERGMRIIYRRDPNYWARDLPVNRGRFNFDVLRYEYFRDRIAEFEALKANEFDLREEFTSKVWATEYDIAAVHEGRMIRKVLPDDNPSGAQGFFINTRRAKFSDPRVREALGLAFDFEWTNRNQFYGLYDRTRSYFENSQMMATGLPGDAESALLEPHRAALEREGFNVDQIFGEPNLPPVSDGSGRDRRLMRRVAELFDQAGWVVKDGRRINAAGEPLEVEFLLVGPTWERVLAAYVENLRFLGVDARIRIVDSSQFEERRKNYDYDLVIERYVMRNTPGVELRSYWSAQAAKMPGTRNLPGISSPVIDALTEEAIRAQSREGLTTATRALDRVLRAGHYWVPHWYKGLHHLAYWDKFGMPEIKPKYQRGVIDTWWIDPNKPDPRNAPVISAEEAPQSGGGIGWMFWVIGIAVFGFIVAFSLRGRHS